jgi:hypothetical protein
MQTLQRPADSTPPRPAAPLPVPGEVRSFRVDTEVCQLANPVIAVQRLLATDANAFARVHGDDVSFQIDILVPADTPAEAVEGWVRWVVHHAGVRGVLTDIGANRGVRRWAGGGLRTFVDRP